MIYDISDPTQPVYKDYFNNRIFIKSVEKGEKVDLSERGNIAPEGLCAIEAQDSPTGKPIVLVANEVSGTVQVIEFDYQENEEIDESEEDNKRSIPWTEIENIAEENKDNFDGNFVRDHKEVTYPVKVNYSFENKGNEVKEVKNLNEDKIYKFYIGKNEYEILSLGESKKVKIDVAPIIENERTLLPMRLIAEILGIDVKWDEDKRLATFTKEGRIVEVQIDSSEIVVNGVKENLYSKVKIENDRILMPLTNISKAFGLTNGNTDDGIDQNIEWNPSERSVTIKNN